MRKALVTISTDGIRDYVTLPSMERLILGPISMLKFVTELTPTTKLARVALDAFLARGEALLTVDLDRMYELLTPRRARWSSTDFLMPESDRTPMTRNPMADVKTIQERLAQVEQVVATLDKMAAQRGISPKHHAQLRAMVAHLGTEPVAAPVVEATEGEPSYDTLQANTALAEDILGKVEATSEKIDQLVTAGRKFNASRAKSDLFGVASRVAELLENVDLAQPWVEKDLTALAQEAGHIHGLFASAKV